MAISKKHIKLGAELGLGLLFLIVLGISYAYSLASRDPDAAAGDWSRAAQHIRARWQPGDFVQVTPVWELKGLRQFKGLAAGIYTRLDKNFTRRFRRIWVAAGHGRPVPGVMAKLKPLEQKAFGAVKVSLFKLKSGAPYYSRQAVPAGRKVPSNFAGLQQQSISRPGLGQRKSLLPSIPLDLRLARVSLKPHSPGGQTVHCKVYGNQRWKCAGQPDWIYFGWTDLPLGGTMRRCFWAHPKTGYTLTARFEKILMQSALIGHYGIADKAAVGGAPPVTLRIKVGDRLAGTYTRPDKPGWIPYAVNTRALAGKKTDVTFLVNADHDGRRHFCFTARIAMGGKK